MEPVLKHFAKTTTHTGANTLTKDPNEVWHQCFTKLTTSCSNKHKNTQILSKKGLEKSLWLSDRAVYSVVTHPQRKSPRKTLLWVCVCVCVCVGLLQTVSCHSHYRPPPPIIIIIIIIICVVWSALMDEFNVTISGVWGTCEHFVVFNVE